MVDVSDPELAKTYKDVRDETKSTDWFIAGYDAEDKNKIILQHSGTKGLSELRDHLYNDQIQFAYVRIVITEGKSNKTKFALISWTGENTGAMSKAKASIHKADVKTIIKDYSADIGATTISELDDDSVTKILSKVP